MTSNGHTIHVIGDNPGGETIRTAQMGATTVRVLDRAVYEKALAAASDHLRAMNERNRAVRAESATGH